MSLILIVLHFVFSNSLFRTWPVLILLGINAAFWYVTAPSVRFAGSTFYSILAVLGASLLSKHTGIKRWGTSGIVTSCLILWWTVVGAYTFTFHTGDAQKGFFSTPTPEPLITATTLSGLEISVPIGNDVITNRCWSSPQPCTPVDQYNCNLALRKENDINSGFRLAETDKSMCTLPKVIGE